MKHRTEFPVTSLVCAALSLAVGACSHNAGPIPPPDAAAVDAASPCGELPDQQSCATGAVAGCGLVCVPGGTFTQGDDRVPSGSPSQGRVTVHPFVIDRDEVTVARFRRFWSAGAAGVNGGRVRYPSGDVPVSADPTEPYWDPRCNWSSDAGAREGHPLNCVTWDQAQAFCVWDANRPPMSQQTGRLPTEAEWEFAAKGAGGRLYPWGDALDPARACVNGDTGAPPRTCAVDDPRFAFDGAPFGLHHMAGNVSEWTADAFWPYRGPDGGASAGSCARAGQTDPFCARVGDAGPGDERVLRGGDWDERYDDLPAAARVGAARGDHPLRGGFRCVRSAP